MKRQKIIGVVLLFAFVITIIGCNSDSTVNGKKYQYYGILNEDENKNPNLVYTPDWWNIAMGAVFCETIIAPVYVFGFNLYKPIAVRDSTWRPGQPIP